MGSPFIKKFEAEGKFYVYDVNTNHILNVDKAVYSVIDSYNDHSRKRVINYFASSILPAKIKKAFAEIGKYEKKGFFSGFRPKGLRYHLPSKEIKKQLESGLQQLILNVTENCNLRCKYCAYSGIYKYKRIHSQRQMHREVAYKAIDFFAKHSSANKEVTIGFYGGEPLLNFGLIKEIVIYAGSKLKNKRARFNITTNGTLINREILDFIIRNDIKMLVSIDGPRDIHDNCRVFADGRGSFDVVKRNLEKIIEYGRNYYYSNVSFNIVLGPPYQLMRIYDFIESNKRLFGKNLISLSDIAGRDTDFFKRFGKEELKNKGYKELKAKFIDGIIRLKKIKNSFLRKFFEDNLIKIYKRDIGRKLNNYEYPNGVCIPGLRRIFVSVEGKFHICEKINEYLDIGDMPNGLDFKKIKSIMDEYAQKSSGDCCKCWALRLCSLCFVHAVTDKLDVETKKQSCLMEERNLLNGLKLYCQILDKNPDALEYMRQIQLS